jgi:hypothetical protein
MSQMSPFKLTFNKPAVQSFFEGEDADGLKVGIEQNAVVFTPVNGSKDSDVIPLLERTRGGVEAVVEGRMAAQLAMALENPHGSFFTLKRMKGGAVQAVPYASADAPSKFTPHMRAWLPKTMDTEGAPAVMPNIDEFPRFLEGVRAAKRLVDEHSTVKRAGRPSREVSEARRLLAQFSELSQEIIPTVSNDEGLLRQAHELLGSIVAGTVTPKAHVGRRHKAPIRKPSARRTTTEAHATA